MLDMSDTESRSDATAVRIGGFRGAQAALKSFDGGEQGKVTLFAPDRYRFYDHEDVETLRISRGAGLSYCAASFSDGGNSVSHKSFNRILDFDSETGEVEVEPGITLQALYAFLIKRRLYLRCHPGHGAITIGGCIAADVHGKNHVRDATFCNQVVSMELFHPSHGQIHLSREDYAGIFDLTCGGFGLTGHIVKARLKPVKVPSMHVRRSARYFESFSDLITALVVSQAAGNYAYTWHDMARPGDQFGAGYLHTGVIEENPGADAVSLDNNATDARLLRRLPQGGVINYLTVPMLNKAYCAKLKRDDARPLIPLHEAVFPLMGSETYFALYGTRGFHEAQVLVPLDQATVLVAFLEASVKRDKLAIALASAKLFDADAGLLRYSGKGLSLAVNLPRSQKSSLFLNELDKVVMACGGKPNIIKDSRLSRDVVDACYPEADRFRTALREFDSKRIFQSALSKRLAL